MVKLRASALLFATALFLTPLFPLSARAQGPRPLVVIFPMGQETATGIAGARDEAAISAERTLQSSNALRDRLADSKALLIIVYTPDSPVFTLAAQDAKLDIKRRKELKTEEQVALGKAAGAVCVLAVTTPKVVGSDYEYDIFVRGQEIGVKKEFTDHVSFTAAAPAASSGDANAVTRAGTTASKRANDSLMGAANTLAIRILNGPLGAYGRPASPNNVLTPPPPKPIEEPVPADTDQSSAALQQARAQINDGDPDGAIITLRKAVNRAPLDLQLRLALTRAYQSAGRSNDAAQEAKRALNLTAAEDRDARIELSRILADAMRKNGDTTAARAMYEQIVTAQPRAAWARVGLGDLLLAASQLDAAEKEYRAALQAEPGNKDALTGIVRVYAARGDFDAAVKEFAASSAAGGSPAGRQAAVLAIFDQAAPEIATLMQTNREAWEGKRLSREAFYRATKAQEQRANSLLTLLRSAPPATAPEAARKSYSRRVLAGSLLCQSAASLLSYLDSGDADAGAQAALYLDDFQKEFAAVK